VPKLEDDKEGVYAQHRSPGRFYVSRRFPEGGKDSDIADRERDQGELLRNSATEGT